MSLSDFFLSVYMRAAVRGDGDALRWWGGGGGGAAKILFYIFILIIIYGRLSRYTYYVSLTSREIEICTRTYTAISAWYHRITQHYNIVLIYYNNSIIVLYIPRYKMSDAPLGISLEERSREQGIYYIPQRLGMFLSKISRFNSNRQAAV